jgi:hypothetical protein
VNEFEVIHPRIAAYPGKVSFANTMSGRVAGALRYARDTHGGSLLRSDNDTWFPPADAICQC